MGPQDRLIPHKEHLNLLGHDCGVVLLAQILLLIVDVDQCLVQQQTEQLGILQTSLDIAVFPEAQSCQVPR